jgi:transposase
VVEVNRPDRQARRRNGKSDPVDADAAARAVQAGEATAAPKLGTGTGTVAMVRALRTARQTAIKARTQTINAIKALLVTAPAELRQQLRKLSAARLVRAAARLDPGRAHHPDRRRQARAADPGRAAPDARCRDRHAGHRAGPADRHRRP